MGKLKKNSRIRMLSKRPLLLYYSVFLLLSFFSIYFVMIQNRQLFYGDDLGFHLGRIEGVAIAFIKGDYFPRINYFLTGGMGYATGIFYPEIFLYPAALLRISGVSLIHSYVIYVFLINFLTFVIAYHSFDYLKQAPRKSLLFAVLYGLSAYRLSDVLYRAAVGEYLALMVLPFVFVGIHLIIFDSYKKWYVLSIGMATLFMAHLLSSGIMILFIFCLLICNCVRLWHEKIRFIALFKAAGVTILLVAVFLCPMIEQLSFQHLRVQDTPMFYLQKMAETPLNYLETAVKNIRFNNIGLLVLFFLILLAICMIKLSSENKQLIGISLLFFYASTSFFPHWLFHETLFNSIQFPWRYFMIVTFGVLWVLADSLDRLVAKRQGAKAVLYILLFVVTLFSTFDMEQKLKRSTRATVDYSYFEQVDGSKELGFGEEFLPSGMENWMAPTGLLSEPTTIKIRNMSRSYSTFFLDYEAPEMTNLIFPLIYYKGYEVKVEGGGTVSKVHDAGRFKDGNMHGFVEVTVVGNGKLTLWYAGTFVQKMSFLVTSIAWVGMIGVLLWSKKIEIKS
ncbi:hypothetical protein UAY_00133 [Enterococcus moraviensis ATCC BAA-383]|uniref:Membrane protein 6-pyruvoyl-tetrahydropterin synthase-related domain-containing protein n=1 Tax=Enterococcus moraviensis ATCC BAA-383 TaxID=1158609 RepID=R2RGK9_9ENTE|nr:hypothetical protein [Enterococcus moraviensis]EOI06791.1 hypothetical protein UAY_00133 [Enterococcus moraviensis ATCC BAA-383]EOT65128.1 hypothetical protein I586_02862 [Enterococcus moraviensis ATCC BAA-383]